jgi:hypothetical protein
MFYYFRSMTETMEKEGSPSFHPGIKLAAKVISIILHPLFIPVYVGWFFIYQLRLFPQLDGFNQVKLLISFFINYTFLPLVSMLIASKLGFIGSIYMHTQKDRIIPYIITGIFYFWVWYVFRNQGFAPAVVAFSLAIFLGSSIGLLLNSYFKISMHGIAIGIMTSIFIILGLKSDDDMGFYISIVILLSGLLATARLVNEDHHPFEIYMGIFAGILAQVIAYLFVF